MAGSHVGCLRLSVLCGLLPVLPPAGCVASAPGKCPTTVSIPLCITLCIRAMHTNWSTPLACILLYSGFAAHGVAGAALAALASRVAVQGNISCTQHSSQRSWLIDYELLIKGSLGQQQIQPAEPVAMPDMGHEGEADLLLSGAAGSRTQTLETEVRADNKDHATARRALQASGTQRLPSPAYVCIRWHPTTISSGWK